MKTMITPNLSTLLKMEQPALGKVLFLLHSLSQNEVYLTKEQRNGEARVSLATKRDQNSSNSYLLNPFDIKKDTFIPPMLSLLLMGYGEEGLLFEDSGIYYLDQTTGTKQKVAKYGYLQHGKFHKVNFSDAPNGQYDVVLETNSKEMNKDFELLDLYHTSLRTLCEFGSIFSSRFRDTWIISIDWNRFHDEEWFLEHTRSLTDSIAKYTVVGFNTQELRRERNCFFAAHRIIRNFPNYTYIAEEQLMQPLRLAKQYVRETTL